MDELTACFMLLAVEASEEDTVAEDTSSLMSSCVEESSESPVVTEVMEMSNFPDSCTDSSSTSTSFGLQQVGSPIPFSSLYFFTYVIRNLSIVLSGK